jgi:hypothetical protein
MNGDATTVFDRDPGSCWPEPCSKLDVGDATKLRSSKSEEANRREGGYFETLSWAVGCRGGSELQVTHC